MTCFYVFCVIHWSGFFVERSVEKTREQVECVHLGRAESVPLLHCEACTGTRMWVVVIALDAGTRLPIPFECRSSVDAVITTPGSLWSLTRDRHCRWRPFTKANSSAKGYIILLRCRRSTVGFHVGSSIRGSPLHQHDATKDA